MKAGEEEPPSRKDECISESYLVYFVFYMYRRILVSLVHV